ncbi:MAG TPA: hypothetical protein DIU07_06875 [Rhodobacteraceae bacterium]|nr:hypothetical protein [Paracoccaceae bacterium]
MSERPDITAALAEGEQLRWQGHPKPGRPVSHRASLIGVLFYSGTIALLLFAWWLEIYKGHLPGVRLSIYGVIGTAAFLAFVGLRVTLLDRRRARARDARTAYAITDRRVLALAGPYTAEVSLGPGVRAELKAGGVNVEGPGAKIRLDRLKDAKAAQGILLAEIGGQG